MKKRKGKLSKLNKLSKFKFSKLLAFVLALVIAIPGFNAPLQAEGAVPMMPFANYVVAQGPGPAGTGPNGEFLMYRWMTVHFGLRVNISPGGTTVSRVTFLNDDLDVHLNLDDVNYPIEVTRDANGIVISQQFLNGRFYGFPGTHVFEIEFENGEIHEFTLIVMDGGTPFQPHATPIQVELFGDGTFTFVQAGATLFELRLYRDDVFYRDFTVTRAATTGSVFGGTTNLRPYMVGGRYTFTVRAMDNNDNRIPSGTSARSNPISIVDGLTLSFDHAHLAQGERSRVIVEGNETPVGRMHFTSSNTDYLYVDAFGNVHVPPGVVVPPAGVDVTVTARTYSYPAAYVIWYENFEDGIIQHSNNPADPGYRRGFNHNWAPQFLNLTGVSLIEGGQTSRTGRFAYTPTGSVPGNTAVPGGARPNAWGANSNATLLALADNIPTGGSLTFWYYDPMNAIYDDIPAGPVKMGAGIHNIGAADNRISGIFFGVDAPTATDRFRGHLYYVWRPGTVVPVWDFYANDGAGAYVPHAANMGFTNGGFRITGVPRSYGWRQFTYVTKATGTYLYIDGVLVPAQGAGGAIGRQHSSNTIPGAFFSTNWNGQGGNNIVRQMHFIDDMYILAPGAAPTIMEEITVTIRVVPRQYEVVVTDRPVFDYFESDYPVFDFANPENVTFTVNPDLDDFVGLAINGQNLGPADFTRNGNVITLYRTGFISTLPQPSATARDSYLFNMVFTFHPGGNDVHPVTFTNPFEVQNNAARRFFFDSLNGNDANDGLTAATARQSLDSLSGKYFPGDEIFLVRGSVWNMGGESVTLTGSGRPDRPITLRAYGIGPRPVINGQGTRGDFPFYMQTAAVNQNVHWYHGAVELIGAGNWELSGLEVTNDCITPIPAFTEQRTTGHRGRWGILVINPYARTRGEMTDANWRNSRVDNILISDMYVHHVNAAGEAFGGGGGVKFAGGIGIVGHTNNMIVENSRVYRVDVEGIRNAIFHPSGTFGSPQHYPKDIENKVIFRNNIVSHVVGDAFVLSGSTVGSLMEHNVVTRMGQSWLHAPGTTALLTAQGLGHSAGAVLPRGGTEEQIRPWVQSGHNYAALWFMGVSNTTARFNEVFDNRYRCNDGEAFDFDAGSYNAVYEFNFSARNDGGMILLMATDMRNNTFRYNISVHDGGFFREHVIYGPNLSNPGPGWRSLPHMHNNTIIIGHNPMLRTLFDAANQNVWTWFENNIVFSTDPNRTLDLVPTDGRPPANNMISDGVFRNNLFYPPGLLNMDQIGPRVDIGDGDPIFGSNIVADPMFVGNVDLMNANLGPGQPTGTQGAYANDPGRAFNLGLIQNVATANMYFDTSRLEPFRLQPGSPAIGTGRVIHCDDGWAIYSFDFATPEHLPYNPANPMPYHEVRLVTDMWGNVINHSSPNIGAYGYAFILMPPLIMTLYLPDGEVGEEYFAALEATGTQPITWTITAGYLPAGLTLDPATGEITGIPEESGLFEGIEFTATNAHGYTSVEFTIYIAGDDEHEPGPAPFEGEFITVHLNIFNNLIAAEEDENLTLIDLLVEVNEDIPETKEVELIRFEVLLGDDAVYDSYFNDDGSIIYTIDLVEMSHAGDYRVVIYYSVIETAAQLLFPIEDYPEYHYEEYHYEEYPYEEYPSDEYPVYQEYPTEPGDEPQVEPGDDPPVGPGDDPPSAPSEEPATGPELEAMAEVAGTRLLWRQASALWPFDYNLGYNLNAMVNSMEDVNAEIDDAPEHEDYYYGIMVYTEVVTERELPLGPITLTVLPLVPYCNYCSDLDPYCPECGTPPGPPIPPTPPPGQQAPPTVNPPAPPRADAPPSRRERTPTPRTRTGREAQQAAPVDGTPAVIGDDSYTYVPVGTNWVIVPLIIYNIEDGTFFISVSGLPEGITVPDYLVFIDGQADLMLMLPYGLAGEFSFIVTLIGEDGHEIAHTYTLLLTIYDPLQDDVPYLPDMAELPAPTHPAAPPSISLHLVIGETAYNLNGRLAFGEVSPFIDPVYNRTMVPLRLIAESLGADVNWIEATRTVTITRNGQVLILQLETPLPDGMGIPMIVGDRTFVPVAYVAQMLGATVVWDGETRSVHISQ